MIRMNSQLLLKKEKKFNQYIKTFVLLLIFLTKDCILEEIDISSNSQKLLHLKFLRQNSNNNIENKDILNQTIEDSSKKRFMTGENINFQNKENILNDQSNSYKENYTSSKSLNNDVLKNIDYSNIVNNEINNKDINSNPNKNPLIDIPTDTKELAANNNTPSNNSSVLNYLKAIASGFSVIILAEIGDKTFFLVMIYSATNSFWSTLLVASSVMLAWNLICLVIGSAIPVLLFKGFLDFIAMLIFLFFGISMVYSAYHMEHELIHKGLNETKSELSRQSLSRISNKENPTKKQEKRTSLSQNNLKEPLIDDRINNDNINERNNKHKSKEFNDEKKLDNEKDNENAYFFEDEEDYEEEEFGFHSKWAFASSLAIAEFGDKTQISSIIMGSTQNFSAVLIGTSLARVCGVVIAVLGGKLIAHNVTHKQVTFIGGFIFILFAIVYMFKFFY